jgi:hypothetical protein
VVGGAQNIPGGYVTVREDELGWVQRWGCCRDGRDDGPGPLS